MRIVDALNTFNLIFEWLYALVLNFVEKVDFIYKKFLKLVLCARNIKK